MILNFFKNDHKSIPKNLIPKLLAVFPTAINIEWNKTGNSFEALFYMDEAEYIARLSENGTLVEYKKNIRTSEIPENIGATATEYGEIMSAIAIHRGETITYEIIIRKKDLSRYLLLLDDAGLPIEMRPV